MTDYLANVARLLAPLAVAVIALMLILEALVWFTNRTHGTSFATDYGRYLRNAPHMSPGSCTLLHCPAPEPRP